MEPLVVDSLTKDYGEVVAVSDLDFAVESGEIFGFLGPNGAGKTTTIRAAMGLIRPTAGTVHVLGRDVRDGDALVEAKRSVGYLPADPAFEESVPGREILDLHGAYKGDQRREELLDSFEPPLDRPVREYSSGNVQKLGIVQAFMHDPDLVIMDEPTSGLDPLLQQRFNEFLREERRRGTTVFFSSHVLSEVRRVCDRVGIIRQGKLVTVDEVHALLAGSGKAVRVRLAGEVPADAFEMPGVADLTRRTVDGGTDFAFTYTGEFDPLVEVLAGHSVRELDVEEAPLEDVFLTYYGETEATDVARPETPAAPADGAGEGRS